MLSLRRETDYAIQMLKVLAKNKSGYISLNELSGMTGISYLFMQKIARKLRQARLIKAGKGVSGGYCLNIPASNITLKKIIEATEGSANILPCFCGGKTVKCLGQTRKCALKGKISKINKSMDTLFSKTHLSDL
jgi:Rrf2 family protein